MQRLLFAIGMALFAVAPVAAQARSELNLTVANASAASALDVTVTGCACKTALHFGLIAKGAELMHPVPVAAGETLTVTARLPESVTVDEASVSVGQQAEDRVALGLRKVPPLDTKGADDLVHLLAQMGPYSGFRPLALESAVPNFLGALVLRDAADPGAVAAATVAPAAIGNAISPGDLDFGPVSSSAHGSFAANAPGIAPALPLLAALGLPLTGDDPISLGAQLTQAGEMTAKPGKLKTFGAALAVLAAQDKATLCGFAASLKNPKLVYITTLYGAGGATFTQTQARTVSADADITGAAVVVGDRAYTFDGGNVNRISLRSAVIGFAGSEVPLGVLCDPDAVVKKRVLVPKMAIYNIHPMTYDAKYHQTVYDRIAATTLQGVVVPARIIDAMAAKLPNPFAVAAAVQAPPAAAVPAASPTPEAPSPAAMPPVPAATPAPLLMPGPLPSPVR